MRDLLIDSSVLVEYSKGNERGVKLLESFEKAEVVLHISDVVFSELFTYFSATILGALPGQ